MFRKAKPDAPAHPATTGSDSSRVAISDAAPCEKSLKLQVGREMIAPVRAAVLAEVQKDATLAGFRKGKAPTQLVERQYAQKIQEETLHRVTKQAFEQVAKAHDLKPIGPFEITKADFNETSGLALEATVEVEPAFTLASYHGIALKRDSVEVTPQEMDRALAQLQESAAQLVPSETEGTKERQLPAIDDELAKNLGFQHLTALKEHVTAKLKEQKQAAQAKALEGALCDELLARHTFDVPPRLVAHQAHRLTRDFKVRLLLSGTPEAQLDAEAAKFAEQLRTSAQRYVKLSFVLDRIASQESITVTQDELVSRLWQLSQRWKKDPAEVRKIFDAQGLWPSVMSALRQEKTVSRLLASAAIEEAPAVAVTESATTKQP